MCYCDYSNPATGLSCGKPDCTPTALKGRPAFARPKDLSDLLDEELLINNPATACLWIVETNSDTGSNDDYFYEWWEITDGKKTFKCDKEEHAVWLRDLLNACSSM